EKPIAIDIPENLIVATKDMVLSNGTPRVGPDVAVGERERAWLDRYQADVAWGNGDAGGIRQRFEMAGALPKDLRHELVTKHECGTWFLEPTEQLVLERYFQSRHLGHKGRDVVMPLIELINHGDEGAGYQSTESISFTGTFPGEIFAR